MHTRHHIDDLITLFNTRFIPLHNTELVCCEPEPIYRPADALHPHHRIIFAHGFFASALHEIAHWCIAGKDRRQQEDFGYWYQPDGRTEEQQRLFESVEVKPQALEWIFSVSAGFHFVFSADNLNGAAGVSSAFRERVREQALHYLHQGLPSDAQLWSETLIGFYRADKPLSVEEFELSEDQ
ncbi:elongation factor P hydroxylase [Hydrogenovibrio sp. JE_KL2]|uniref:elongation factor P hydroxylase n=1 Tax=Hydrogenovibrio sp. JE_KL2 TaxID=2651188 RepID=UPI00128E40A8|nr:elongation factor P hydroxylase [Hydrogenovibrio sp. JE_KL2]MPQ76899.1 elongation factor P hydroxylase [Hydrogenovibrio sp. JE_KL2]